MLEVGLQLFIDCKKHSGCFICKNLYESMRCTGVGGITAYYRWQFVGQLGEIAYCQWQQGGLKMAELHTFYF